MKKIIILMCTKNTYFPVFHTEYTTEAQPLERIQNQRNKQFQQK